MSRMLSRIETVVYDVMILPVDGGHVSKVAQPVFPASLKEHNVQINMSRKRMFSADSKVILM